MDSLHPRSTWLKLLKKESIALAVWVQLSISNLAMNSHNNAHCFPSVVQTKLPDFSDKQQKVQLALGSAEGWLSSSLHTDS